MASERERLVDAVAAAARDLVNAASFRMPDEAWIEAHYILELAAALAALDAAQPVEPSVDVEALKAAGWHVAVYENGAAALWWRSQGGQKIRQITNVLHDEGSAWAYAAQVEARREGQW